MSAWRRSGSMYVTKFRSCFGEWTSEREAVYHLHLLDSCLPREYYIGSDDEVAGGQPLLNYDDEVCLIRSFAIPAHESRSGHSITLPEGCRARVRRTWGPAEQPTTVLVETF